MEKYTGSWTPSEAKHILRRTLYGPSRKQILESSEKGMEWTIQELLRETPMPDPPLNYIYEEDPEVPIGESWVGKPLGNQQIDGYRRRSLRAWTIGLGIKEELSIREKMFLFWHNHFAIADINRSSFEYNYADLIRKNALGNFKTLVKEITINPAMLRYLNGNQNTVINPNENYARELLELFTIGKGDQVAEGDYTHYTEDDVVAIAKVLTGWRDIGYNPRRNIQPAAIFLPNQHDTSTKVLSERFNFAEITNQGDEEYKNLIDVIFGQQEVSRFIARKIYRWFVYHKIDDQVEAEIIEPMAQILRDADYEMVPMLEALFTSAHFYQETFKGAMIKSPMDYTMGMFTELGKQENGNLRDEFLTYNIVLRVLEFMEQIPFGLPDVAGWKAYYQEPQFYQTWISSSTMQFRKIFRGIILEGAANFNGELRNIPLLRANLLQYVDALDNPSDPNLLIEELVLFLFPHDISSGQKAALKEVLLPGLPDYEWTVEYNDYLANPDNEDFAAPIRNKLTELVSAMTAMPEYYVA